MKYFLFTDAENDQIAISCEEDFRLFIEQGKGRKIYFDSSFAPQQQQNDEPETMDSEDAETKYDRKSRKW